MTSDDRHDRTARAIGPDALDQLQDTHIAVVGAGGTGSTMSEGFARYSVGELSVIDHDLIEESNLPRLSYTGTPEHVGLPKVGVLKEYLGTHTPDTTVHPVMQKVQDAGHFLKRADLIVAGVDRVSPRLWLNEFAARHEQPYIDAGVVIHTADGTVESMDGVIQRIVPGVTACFQCLDRLDRERARIERLPEEEREDQLDEGYIDESDLTPEPAVGPLNGVVASLAVEMAVRHVTRYKEPADLIEYEAVTHTLDEKQVPARNDCAVCGDDSVRGRGDETPAPDDTTIDGFDPDTALED